MTIGGKSKLLLLCTIIFSGFEASALSYDYTASIECMENPHKPQYGGGIIVNPELNHGLKGWSTFGEAKIQHRQSQAGNKFAVARSRNQAHAGISQKTFLQRNKLYTFSAWIQVSGGSGVPVTAIFKTSAGSFIHAGAIVAESKCWSMLKGGLTVNASGLAELYFESKNTTVEIWVDSISLQPFTEKEWKSHHDQSIKTIRKTNLRIQAVYAKGNPLPNATISIQQKAPCFPFGCAMNKNILTNTLQGQEDYSAADAMLQFAKQQNIAVRGHNVFWDDPQYQLGWVKSLDTRQLARAAFKRLYSCS